MKNRTILIIHSLALMSVLAFRIFSSSDHVPTWDESHHLSMGFLFYKAIISFDLSNLFTLYTSSHQLYPPIYHILIAISYILFGVFSSSARYLNVLLIPILVGSVYLLASKIFNKNVGLVSALLVPILPLSLRLQEVVFIDYLSISLFVLSFYLLFQTDYFRNTKFTLLFGLITCINLLTKWPIVVPSIVFFIYLYMGFKDYKEDRRKIFINLSKIAPFIFLSATWYYFNSEDIARTLDFYSNPNNFTQKLWQTSDTFTFKNLLLYIHPYGTGNRGIGIVPIIVFFVSLFLKYQSKDNSKIKYLLGSIVITYISLTLLNDKSAKYIGYVYPLVIIYSVGKITNLKDGILKKVLISVLCVSIVLNLAKSYVEYDEYYYDDTETFRILPGYYSPLNERNWPTRYMFSNTLSKKCRGRVLTLVDKRYLNFVNLNFLALKNNIDLQFETGYQIYDPTQDFIDDIKRVEEYSCIITKTDDLGLFANRIVANKIEYHAIYVMSLKHDAYRAPDDSVVKVYYR